jgi:hypothetical protein
MGFMVFCRQEANFKIVFHIITLAFFILLICSIQMYWIIMFHFSHFHFSINVLYRWLKIANPLI